MRNQKRVARTTATIAPCAIRFRLVLQAIGMPVYRTCLTTIYARGLRLLEGARLQVAQVDSARPATPHSWEGFDARSGSRAAGDEGLRGVRDGPVHQGRSSTDGSRDVRSGIGPTSACRFAQARLRSDATSRTTPPMSATAPRIGGSGIRWCSSALISMDPVSSTVFSRVQRMPPVSNATMPMTTKIRPTMRLADIYPPIGVAGARGSPVSAEKQKGQGSLASSASVGVTAACGDGHGEAEWNLPRNLASLTGFVPAGARGEARAV